MRVFNKRFSIWLLVSLLACSKSNDYASERNFLIPKGTLDYLIMPADQYFIYRDSTTGRLDSVMVEECKTIMSSTTPSSVLVGSGDWSGGMFGYDRTAPQGYNEYEIYIVKLKFLNNAAVWLQGSSFESWGWSSSTIKVTGSSEILLDDSTRWYGMFFYNSPNPGMGSYLPTFQVEGKTYREVMAINSINAEFYWAKGIGIVKRVFITNNGRTTSTLVKKNKI